MKSKSRRVFLGSAILLPIAAYLSKLSINHNTEEAVHSLEGIGSGYPSLDKIIGGLHPGELAVLGSRPSMGKTSFSLNHALNISSGVSGRHVAYFSLEASKEQTMLRLLSILSGLSLSKLRTSSMEKNEWASFIHKAKSLSEEKIFIDDTSAITPAELRNKCLKLKVNGQLDLVIVDNLQLMSLKEKSVSREQEVSAITRQLKSIAKELKIPIVVLAQLNRGVEGRFDRRPVATDLRESGAIEQIADVIMFLYRDEYYDREDESVRGLAEIIVAKNRRGPTGVAKMKFIANCGRFEEMVV